jgi:hypothetical protein
MKKYIPAGQHVCPTHLPSLPLPHPITFIGGCVSLGILGGVGWPSSVLSDPCCAPPSVVHASSHHLCTPGSSAAASSTATITTSCTHTLLPCCWCRHWCCYSFCWSSTAVSPAAVVTASHMCTLLPPMLLLQLQLQLWNCIFWCCHWCSTYVHPPSHLSFGLCVLALHSPPFCLWHLTVKV